MSSRPSLPLISPSGRLKIIAAESKYDKDIARLRSHPETLRYLPFLPAHVTVDDACAMRETRAKQDSTFDMYILLDDGDGLPKFVGLTGLYHIDTTNGSCSVGILIHPDYFRGGFATQVLYTVMKCAFEDPAYHMHRVAFETGADNVQMRGWLERVAGVQLEFHWREAWKVEAGKWVDAVGYSILEHEWRDTVKGKLEARLKIRQDRHDT